MKALSSENEKSVILTNSENAILRILKTICFCWKILNVLLDVASRQSRVHFLDAHPGSAPASLASRQPTFRPSRKQPLPTTVAASVHKLQV
jgi:hypothetical protein